MLRVLLAIFLIASIAGVGLAIWLFYDPEVVLDYEKQVLIWDAESATFQIETHFSKGRFVKALKAGDRELLATCFRDDFTGKLLVEDSPGVIQVSTVTERKLERGKAAQRDADANAVMDQLLAQLEPFAEIKSASQRVLEIHPITRMKEDTGRWQLRLLHMFYGTGPNGEMLAHESEHDAVLEYTARDQLDSKEPLLISWDTIYIKNTVSPHPLLEEVTKEYGLDLDASVLEDNWEIPVEANTQQKLAVAVEDFDRDGYLDIAVASLSKARQMGLPVLLRNIGGKRFEDVTAQYGIRPWQTTDIYPQFAAGWIDIENDGYPDLILGNRVYQNVRGQRFLDITEQSGLRFYREPMGVTVADYNNDGFADVYMLYQTPDDDRERQKMAGKPMPWIGDNHHGAENQLWMNNGNGTFRRALGTGAEAGKGSSFAATWFHLDDNLYPDVYIVNDFGDNVLLRNKGDGTFEDVTTTTGTGGFATSMGVASGDINNDGTPELYVGNMYSKMGRRIIAHIKPSDYPDGVYRQLEGACAGNHLYQLKPGQTQFQELSENMGINAVGWAFAPSFVDFDGDGLLDIYANAGFVSFSRGRPDG